MKRWYLIPAACAAVLGVTAAGLIVRWCSKGVLDPSGGLYFPRRVEISIPAYQQGDKRWRDDPLGATEGTLGQEGCAVASAAMVLGGYGVEIDPQKLNNYLTTHEGYTERGWMYWEKAAEMSGGSVEHVYEDLPSYYLIDRNLFARNPVIIRLRFPSGITHFVVIVGKEGFDYLIRDPGAGSRKGVYPLREFGSRIEALRFYRLTGKPASTPSPDAS